MALLAFFALAIPISFLFLQRTQESLDLGRYAQTHQILIGELDSLNKFLEKTSKNLFCCITQDNRERTYLQMSYIHPDVWSMGIGGRPYDRNPKISRKTNALCNDIYEQIDVLKGQSQLRKTSIEKISENIAKNIHLWTHLPSTCPVPSGHFSSGFGYRIDPITHQIRMHTGLDISSPRGTPIYASADGVVSRNEWSTGGYGWVVEIDHGYGFKTRYAHCHNILVKEGDIVRRGQLIATIGSTGRSIAPHLHYEVEISGVKVNPKRYIDQLEVIVD